MKPYRVLFIVFTIFCSTILINSTEKATMIHNTLGEYKSCEGKLELALVRTWGGDEETDENKFFETPSGLVVSNDNEVFILDKHKHNVKLFNLNGSYLRTIGQRGKGPGDLHVPEFFALGPDGNLWVAETGGRRVQQFDEKGNSLSIFKADNWVQWIGVNSKNEIALYQRVRTFNTKRLLAVYNSKGKLLREVGTYHVKGVSNPYYAEGLSFSLDKDDNFIAANIGTPLIRIYSREGKLIRVITYDMAKKVPTKISLNPNGDEIVRENDCQTVKTIVVGKGKKGAAIKTIKNKDCPRFTFCAYMTSDVEGNIYIMSSEGGITQEQQKATMISGSIEYFNRSLVKYDILETIDVNRILVFNPDGKIIAVGKFNNLCQSIYVSGDRLFLIDGHYNQHIREYKMTFKN